MKKTVTIEGMSCMHCKMRVENALKAVPGVKDAAVDLRRGTAAVTCENVADEALLSAVRKAGYDPKKIEG
ncbi:MAG: heavy-metal-associated domain-containing protein [Candidatus Izemoplasmatales bacterium]